MTDDEKPTIAVRENAFIRVANLPRLENSDGTELELKPVMALCRCGNSQNKPFCDGSHKKVGFDGSSPDPADPPKDKILSYEGSEIDVHYSLLLCSHAAECGKRHVEIFDSKKRPWIQPDNGTIEAVEEVVRACPSGALRYNGKGEEPKHLDLEGAGIVVEKNGPLRVTNMDIEEVNWASAADRKSYVLCRCGLSKNKPFCDGTHKDEGWRDDS